MSKKGQDPGLLSSGRGLTVRVESAKGRNVSSTRWLKRQLNDPYVRKAQAAGYRSRAAFKLIELDDRFRVIKKGSRVIDLGAAPGGWTQVALDRVGAAGKVVALDIKKWDEVSGATCLSCDFMDDEAPNYLKEALGHNENNLKVDVILSDMAAPTTGHSQTDHLRIIALAEAAWAFAEEVLAPGGAFICKVFQGGTEMELLKLMRARCAKVAHAKPPASRKESSEMYVVAKGFRG